MKKVFSLWVVLTLIFNISFGYTLTINFNGKTTTAEVEAGENMIIGLGDRSEAVYSVDTSNVALRKLGNQRQFIMPAENVEITINKESSEPNPDPGNETYIVSFNSNGGSEVADKTIILGATYGDLQTPQKTGYTFGGWYLDSNCTMSQVISSTIVETANNHTLYAKWTANEYTITLDNQEATTAGTTSITVTYGNAMPNITVPIKTGYIFGGYYTQTNGSGTQYYKKDGTSASNWDQIEAITLYAQWTQMGIPEMPNLIDAHDTGSSATDNVTKYYEDLTIEGQVSLANAIVKIYKNGEYYGQTTSDEQGYWTTTVDNDQNVWTAYRATMIDENGNESNMSEALAIYSDTILPTLASIETRYYAFALPYTYTNYSVPPTGQVGTTSTNDPMITFTNTSSIQNVSKVNIYFNEMGISAGSTIEVFYDTGSGFNASQVVQKWIDAGTTSVSIDIPTGTYNAIRVDIGTASGLSYQVNRIDFTAPSGQGGIWNIVNYLTSNPDATTPWKFQKYNNLSNTWIDFSGWDEYSYPADQWVCYRVLDCAGNEGETSESLHISQVVPPTTEFGYTGGIQSYTAPTTGIYKLEVWGAGGNNKSASENPGMGGAGGAGGYSCGYAILSEGQTLYVTVGGAGNGTKYNGGGSGGGGGATHIATVSGTISSIGSANLEKILIIAGGGGRGGTKTESWGGIVTYEGGTGGGTSSGDGSATQSSGYAFGQGASNGGGGLYGGVNKDYYGGGGSGYIGGVPSFTYNGTTYSPSTINGAGSAAATDGRAVITFMQ